MEEDSRRMEVTRFSTPRTTPSEVHTPMAVDPSCYENVRKGGHFDRFDGIFDLEQSSSC
jgi:hypothetical protein